MNCQFCHYPIPSLKELEADEQGRRVQGAYCTHCEMGSQLVEIVFKQPKFSPAEIVHHRNRNT